jgi:hypothetical protein
MQSSTEGTMSEKLNLKELERKAWRSFFDDGLWDIYFGLLLALMGVSAFMNNLELTEALHMGIYIGLLIIVMLGFWAAKRFITVPRIGMVKFGAERRKRRIKTSLVLFASVVFGFILFLVLGSVARGDINRDLPWDVIVPAAWAFNMLLVFGLMGYFLEFERLYFIGLVYAIVLPLDYILRKVTELKIVPYMFVFAGFIIVAVGSGYLIRFLHIYPVIQEGA